MIFKNKFESPIILIALLDEELIGTITIANQNTLVNNNCSPWISNMYVGEDKRNLGIGTYLHNYIVEEALTLGYENLYTASEDEYFFERLGWEVIDRLNLANSKELKIYKKDIEY